MNRLTAFNVLKDIPAIYELQRRIGNGSHPNSVLAAHIVVP